MKNENNEKKVVMFRPVPIEHEPTRFNRFILKFPEEFKIESFMVQTVSRPKLKLVNDKYVWSNIVVELYDMIAPSTGSAIYKVIQDIKIKKQKRTWFKKNKSALFCLTLSELDPTGVEISKWTIVVKDLLHVDFGQNDYSSSDLQMITVAFEPLDCYLVTLD